MTQTTELLAGPAEGQSLFVWARQVLSAPRARAFENALRAIDDSRFSAEWNEARRVADAIEREARMARAGEIEAVRTVARKKIEALEAQIATLRDEQIAIRKASDEAENVIYSEVNKLPAVVTAYETATALWHRDNDAVVPQRQALVAKYITAQAKVGA